MIDYQFQHNSHVVDFRMYQFIYEVLPESGPTMRSAEQIEYERNWLNFQTQLYYYGGRH